MKSAEEWAKELVCVSPENQGHGFVEFVEAIREEQREECAEAYMQDAQEEYGRCYNTTRDAILNAGKTVEEE